MIKPQTQTQIEEKVKRYGQWSVVGEKLRISYKDSEESVLFEDTASISYLKVSLPDVKYGFYAIAIGIF